MSACEKRSKQSFSNPQHICDFLHQWYQWQSIWKRTKCRLSGADYVYELEWGWIFSTPYIHWRRNIDRERTRSSDFRDVTEFIFNNTNLNAWKRRLFSVFMLFLKNRVCSKWFFSIFPRKQLRKRKASHFCPCVHDNFRNLDKNIIRAHCWSVNRDKTLDRYF